MPEEPKKRGRPRKQPSVEQPVDTTENARDISQEPMQPISAIDDFIKTTSASTAAIIVPLFGYSNEDEDNMLIKEHVLSFVMNRVYSHVHNYLIVFVANPETVDNTPNDPNSVANVIIGRSKSGNVQTIPVGKDATYGEHIQAGLDFVMNETKSNFIVIFNPWTMVQHGAIDAIIDRCNRGDEAKVVCGRDYRNVVNPESFDDYQDLMLNEEWDVSTNLVAFPRFIQELCPMDTRYNTHTFIAQDFAHSVKKNGYASINYPQAGIFPFDFPWNKYETKTDKEEDKAHFTEKWGFSIEA